MNEAVSPHVIVLQLLDLHIAGAGSMELRRRLWIGLRKIAERHSPDEAGDCTGCTSPQDHFGIDWPCADFVDLANALGFELN